jgi:hypothetical protein
MNRWFLAALCWVIALLLLVGIGKPTWRVRWFRTAREAGGPRISALTAGLFGLYFILFGFELSLLFPTFLPRILMPLMLVASVSSSIRDYALAKRN